MYYSTFKEEGAVLLCITKVLQKFPKTLHFHKKRPYITHKERKNHMLTYILIAIISARLGYEFAIWLCGDEDIFQTGEEDRQ